MSLKTVSTLRVGVKHEEDSPGGLMCTGYIMSYLGKLRNKGIIILTDANDPNVDLLCSPGIMFKYGDTVLMREREDPNGYHSAPWMTVHHVPCNRDDVQHQVSKIAYQRKASRFNNTLILLNLSNADAQVIKAAIHVGTEVFSVPYSKMEDIPAETLSVLKGLYKFRDGYSLAVTKEENTYKMIHYLGDVTIGCESAKDVAKYVKALETRRDVTFYLRDIVNEAPMRDFIRSHFGDKNVETYSGPPEYTHYAVVVSKSTVVDTYTVEIFTVQHKEGVKPPAPVVMEGDIDLLIGTLTRVCLDEWKSHLFGRPCGIRV